jgi:hypothetical protein
LAIVAAWLGAIIAAPRGSGGLRLCLFALAPTLSGVALLLALALGVDAHWLASLQDGVVAADDWLMSALRELGVAVVVALRGDLLDALTRAAAILSGAAGALSVVGLLLHARRRGSAANK